MKTIPLRSEKDLTQAVEEIGLLPLFAGKIPGFSAEEMTPRDMWFQDGVEGPWEWREALAAEGRVVYAKLFHGKAGFVSRELFGHLANYRRQGYDFDARVDDGLARESERRLYALIQQGYGRSDDMRKAFGGKGLESARTALQMQTYIAISGFERHINRRGEPYGWAMARYALAEDLFGDLCASAYDFTPEASLEILCRRLSGWLTYDQALWLLQ